MDKKQKVLQKIEHVCESVSLDGQGHSPRPRGEDLLRQLYACDGLQYRIQHIEVWTSHRQLSMASPEEREEEEPVHKNL
jgi:hypothetical protein